MPTNNNKDARHCSVPRYGVVVIAGGKNGNSLVVLLKDGTFEKIEKCTKKELCNLIKRGKTVRKFPTPQEAKKWITTMHKNNGNGNRRPQTRRHSRERKELIRLNR